MKLREASLEFDFTDAIDAIKFDGASHGLPCMKAVDFVVEFDKDYLFVEVKDPSAPGTIKPDAFIKKLQSDELSNSLVGKFRDTFLYRWAQKKADKKIHYISLITLDSALLLNLQEKVRRKLPISFTSWPRPLAKSCHIMNIELWNRQFPKWPIKRI